MPSTSGLRGHGGHPDAELTDLFAKRVTQADIGRELGISHQTVSDWHKLWKVGGKKALKRTGAPGRPWPGPDR